MAGQEKELSLSERAAARLIDGNGNGRLDAKELLDAEYEVLLRVAISTKLQSNSVSENATQVLESMTLDQARSNFARFQRENSKYFPCGIELPSDTQLMAFVTEARATAKDIRNNKAHPSVAAKLDAAMFFFTDNVQTDVNSIVATFQAYFDGPQPNFGCTRNDKGTLQK